MQTSNLSYYLLRTPFSTLTQILTFFEVFFFFLTAVSFLAGTFAVAFLTKVFLGDFTLTVTFLHNEAIHNLQYVFYGLVFEFSMTEKCDFCISKN